MERTRRQRILQRVIDTEPRLRGMAIEFEFKSWLGVTDRGARIAGLAGYNRLGQPFIWLRKDLPDELALTVLAHEAAHHARHDPERLTAGLISTGSAERGADLLGGEIYTEWQQGWAVDLAEEWLHDHGDEWQDVQRRAAELTGWIRERQRR